MALAYVTLASSLSMATLTGPRESYGSACIKGGAVFRVRLDRDAPIAVIRDARPV